VVCFTLRPLYPRYLLDERLGGLQSQSGNGRVEKTKLPTLSHQDVQLVTILCHLNPVHISNIILHYYLTISFSAFHPITLHDVLKNVYNISCVYYPTYTQ
jgi:hypothetical protein